jgi:hypothetical protein
MEGTPAPAVALPCPAAGLAFMVTVFALAAALLYGGADFLGGAATRRAHVLAVLAVSVTSGAVVAVAAAPLAGEPPQGRPAWPGEPAPGWPGLSASCSSTRASRQGR